MSLEVALTGGLATGKSFVGGVLVELGCHLLQADRFGHEALAPGGEAHDEVVRRFGTADRAQLGRIVFGDATRLAELNAILHPTVDRLRRREAARIAAEDAKAIILCEAAIYFETGAWRKFDKVILVVCGRELQIERAMARSGWTREEVEARLAHQWPDEDKRKLADFVIDTSHSMEQTRRQCVEVYNQLKAL
jgi:dephospho-CoA kinase